MCASSRIRSEKCRLSSARVHELCQPTRAQTCLRSCVASRQNSIAIYLLKEIPEALTQTLEGVDRVVTIVRAMKEFAAPRKQGHGSGGSEQGSSEYADRRAQ